MKIILTAVFLLIAILSPATAQQGGDSYIVYSVAGSVKSAGHPIQPKQKLFPLQTITIGKESQLTLLNEDAKLLYSLNRTGTWTVKEYIHDMKPSVLRLSPIYQGPAFQQYRRHSAKPETGQSDHHRIQRRRRKPTVYPGNVRLPASIGQRNPARSLCTERSFTEK